jgi:2'-hydroxyisoflavone reductase
VRLLILGGTKYLGRHLAEHALAGGHDVTLFHRGQTGAGLFPGVPRLIGDRTTPDGLAALATGTWDAVADFSGFQPRQVAATAGLLAPRIGQYIFMSSIAVYPRSSTPGRTENTATRPAPADLEAPFTDQTYGPLKAACERAAEAACPGRSTTIRAGLVIGPGDPFGAFASWAVAMGGDRPVPCAARPGQPVQVTDVRDLAAFIVRAATVPLPGPFNVLSPPMTFADMLETCRVAGGRSAVVRWNPGENIDGYGASIVNPPGEDGIFTLSCARAEAAGFRGRPFAETARDTIEWARRVQPVFTSPH